MAHWRRYRLSRWQFSALQTSSKDLGPQYWTWKTWEGKRFFKTPHCRHCWFMTSTMWWEDKKWFLIGQVSKGEFGATRFSKMERKLWLAKQWKGMLFGCEQPFLWGEHCVTSQKTAAKETTRLPTARVYFLSHFLRKKRLYLSSSC